ncbi:MAG: DUF4328 domain-containing protein [Actinomycetota bacterium]
MTDHPQPGWGESAAGPPPGPPPGAPPPPPPPANLTPPPGYQAYQNSPVPFGTTLSRVSGLSKAIVIVTALVVPATLAALAASFGIRDSADDFLAGRISEDDFTGDYAAVGLFQILAGVLTIAVIVLTMIWLYRVAANVQRMGRATTWVPLWAVFGWVLPPLLYIIPLLMLREVWKASNPAVPPGDQSWKNGDEQPLLWGWFLTYSVVPVVLAVFQLNAAFGGGIGGDVDDLADQVSDLGAVDLLGGIVSTIAAVLWILLVRAITARHTRLTGES